MGSIFPRKKNLGIVGIGFSLILAMVMVFLVVNPMRADLTAASIAVDKTVAQAQSRAGSAVNYRIVVSNAGDLPASDVVLTDTLPADLAFRAGSISIVDAGGLTFLYGESNGVITWTGTINPQGSVELSFSAVLTDTLLPGAVVTNSVVATGTGSLVSSSAATEIISSTEIFLPLVMKPVPAPQVNAIVRTSSSNQWEVSWTYPTTETTNYDLQEANGLDFAGANEFAMGTSYSKSFSPAESINNRYCYRARAQIGSLVSPWSNVECVYGNYRDDFDSNQSGWSIRRQDTDDVENSAWYDGSGKFVLKIGGRWDYAIASPMAVGPDGAYEIETLVQLGGGIDNLHTYGIIFGADWNGQPCPADDYSSCFNHYYRLMAIWYGSEGNDKLRVEVKRMDYHDPLSNAGRGTVKIIDWTDFSVGNDSGWNKWNIQVRPDGQISVYANDKYVGGGVDTTYVNDRYFGVFAASNEYLGTEAYYDYFRVSALR